MKRTWILGLVAAGSLLGAGAARASDVHWSIGVNLPPVATVISSGPSYFPAPPVVYAPGVGYAPPVVYQEPVYEAPTVVYREPRAYYRPPTVVYRAPTVAYTSPFADAALTCIEANRCGSSSRWLRSCSYCP